MFKIIISLKEIGQSESLAEACRIFLNKIERIIHEEGGISKFVLYEACFIRAVMDGRNYLMNFHAIVNFSYSVGILREDNSLSDQPVPYIPKDIVKGIVVAASEGSCKAFINEQYEALSQLVAASPVPNEQEEEKLIIT